MLLLLLLLLPVLLLLFSAVVAVAVAVGDRPGQKCIRWAWSAEVVLHWRWDWSRELVPGAGIVEKPFVL